MLFQLYGDQTMMQILGWVLVKGVLRFFIRTASDLNNKHQVTYTVDISIREIT